jgi:glycosyltransferase involved in cell wall biosynthesis
MRQGRLSGGMARIAVLFPSFLGGGAEAVCLWMLEALRQEYEVTLHTFSDVDFASLNDYYGTHIGRGEVRVVHPLSPAALSRLLAGGLQMFTLRQHLLIRHLKRLRERYDLRISAFNEMDLGAPGIQYIHFPLFARGSEAVRGEVQAPDSPARSAYRSLCRLLSRFSEKGIKENLTVANSAWTAGIVRRAFGIEARVIYPPVTEGFPVVPWESKRNGFIVLGRIVPEKRIETAFEIVRGLRARGLDLTLCIAGRSGAPSYLARLRGLMRGSEGWAAIRTDLTREGLCRIVAGYRYGLHVRENEQFGIAVAEMLKAGCLPFVSARGGQSEVVGGLEPLLFDGSEQAVAKIAAVLASSGEQQRLRLDLEPRARMFSTDRFMAEIRGVVREFLAA